MSRAALAALFALLGFAANSILCRMALREVSIDPASFTSVRVISGALTLWLLVRLRGRRLGGDWGSALALIIYAVAFSFAYVALTAGTGALLLFGAVQLAMILAGVLGGERVDMRIGVGWMLAATGVLILVLPGVAAAPPTQAALMICAGIAWGVYSLRGRRSRDPLTDTAGNFARAAPCAVAVSAIFWPRSAFGERGLLLAALSGSVASGLGYAAWYTALPRLGAITAANLQLSVPVIASLAGVALFGEPVTPRLAVATVLLLGGITLATRRGTRLRG